MTTTQGAIRRLELMLARTPDMECADDLRVVLADAVLARRLLDDARAQKPVEQKLAESGVFKGADGLRKLAEKDSFWDDQPYGTRLYFGPNADDYLHRSILKTAIELLDAAPVPAQPAIAAYMAAGGDEESNPIERLRFYLSCALKGRDWHDVEPFIDAISKAQPAAVPEAVAKDAARYRWLRQCPEDMLGTGDRICIAVPDTQMRCGFDFYSEEDADSAIDAALLSAADTEVKK